ncbi:hypothetical protein ACFQ2A_17445 [Variovorax dokdonensis]|uniref:hypothetical protein n=1 Tax=Variovorax dokdonensis TaxID=344883 RepID=UPI00363132DA
MPDFHSVLVPGSDVEPLAAMMRKGRPGLKQVADETIRGMASSGELETLYRKWFQGPFTAGGRSIDVPMSDMWRSVVFPSP